MVKSEKIIKYLTLSGLILITSILIFIIFYLLSYIITPIGSIICFILLCYLSLKQILRIIIFPGTAWHWRRAIEKSYATLITTQLRYRINELKAFLQLSSTNPQSRNYCNLPSIIEYINNTISVLKSIQEQSNINIYQENLLSILLDLNKHLENIEFKYLDQTISLLLWCKDLPCNIEKITVISESPQIPQELLNRLDLLLKKSDSLFKSLEYMRTDLMNNIRSEQIWLEMDDHVKIDW